jgi:triacylglycerol lipase
MRHTAYGLFALALVTGCSSASSDTAAKADEGLNASGSLSATYTQTRYPIVLVPGIMGFRTILGSLNYFDGIPEALAEGGAQAFVVTTSQANSDDVRVQQLLPQIETILSTTGASHVNLIGHSQGAIDARLIADLRPDIVASVTSVGGPNQGSPVADFMLSVPLGPQAFGLISDFTKLLVGSPYPNDATVAFQAMSTQGMKNFNASHSAALPTTPCGEGEHVVNGIHYYSWGATAWLTNAVDILDPLWLLLGPHVPEPSDGLVGKCSSHLGEVLRDDYFQNHIDETNMLLGLVFPVGTNPKSIFREHANRLKNEGL